MKRRWLGGLLAVSLALGACGRPEEEYQRQVRRVQQLTTELGTMRTERDHLQEQLRSLQASNETMARRLQELGVSINETREALEAARRREEELRRQQEQAERRMATFRQMMARFRSMIDSGRLRVRPVRGRLVIELPAGILFASGEARLSREGETVIREVATVLRDIPDRDFLVAGHTDNVALGRSARFADNWELSTARAVNVARALQTNGLAPQHLGASGYAEFSPAVENDSEEHRAQNRRVEIILMPNIIRASRSFHP